MCEKLPPEGVACVATLTPLELEEAKRAYNSWLARRERNLGFAGLMFLTEGSERDVRRG
jgi:hypothetical protein